MIALNNINKTIIFPFNLPTITKLNTTSNFNIKLLNNNNLKHKKLTQTQNKLLSLTAQSPNQITKIHPNNLKNTPMFKININTTKTKTINITLSNINQTISTTFNNNYINNFLNQKQIKKIYIQTNTPFHILPNNINQ